MSDYLSTRFCLESQLSIAKDKHLSSMCRTDTEVRIPELLMAFVSSLRWVMIHFGGANKPVNTAEAVRGTHIHKMPGQLVIGGPLSSNGRQGRCVRIDAFVRIGCCEIMIADLRGYWLCNKGTHQGKFGVLR